MKSIMEYCYQDYLKNGTGQIKIVRNDGNVSIDDPRRWFDPKYELSAVDVECLSSIESGNILDIACGTGVHMRYLQNQGRKVYGFDLSEFSISLAKKMGTKNVYVKSFWDFDIGIKFDNAICMNGSMGFIGEISKLKDFMEKCHMFLKKGGFLYLQGVDWRIDPMKKHTEYIQNNIEKGVYPGVVTFHQEYKEIVDEEFKWIWIDTDSLREVAIESDFEIVSLKYFGAKYFFILKAK